MIRARQRDYDHSVKCLLNRAVKQFEALVDSDPNTQIIMHGENWVALLVKRDTAIGRAFIDGSPVYAESELTISEK